MPSMQALPHHQEGSRRASSRRKFSSTMNACSPHFCTLVGHTLEGTQNVQQCTAHHNGTVHKKGKPMCSAYVLWVPAYRVENSVPMMDPDMPVSLSFRHGHKRALCLQGCHFFGHKTCNVHRGTVTAKSGAYIKFALSASRKVLVDHAARCTSGTFTHQTRLPFRALLPGV